MSKPSFALRLVPLLAAVGFSACATLKAPTLQVESLRVDKIRVTGAGLDVGFRVQNPNPEPLLIERFEYELKLNGRGLGRGYYSEPINLDGFKNERLNTSFGLNFLSLPAVIQRLLDADRAKVEVKGTFYVRQGEGLKKLGFKNGADVDLHR